MRGHLVLFEYDVLTYDGIVLLQLKLTLLGALVFGGVVREAGAGARDETDVVAHGRRWLSCARRQSNGFLGIEASLQ